jgi:hypothetical protein
MSVASLAMVSKAMWGVSPLGGFQSQKSSLLMKR